MNRKKREIYDDLPPRSDPNYARMYREKNKERLKKRVQEWHKEKIIENPNYYKERYDSEKAANYREKNKEVLSEKQWKKRGIIDLTYKIYTEDLKLQEGKCKICEKMMVKPQADHNHNTGNYRALLCVPCNNGLGVYEKNKDIFEKYLLESK
jgi:hypothetical protein